MCARKRIAVFGGTFDPVHIGHLRSALEVVEELELEQLRLMPNADPPHRARPAVDASQRLRLLQLAVANEPALVIDERELQRRQTSWTIDSLLSLRQELGPQVALYFVLGQDTFQGLPGWHRWQEILEHCHLLVLQRPDMAVSWPQQLQELVDRCQAACWREVDAAAGNIFFLQQTPLPVSATDIRQRLVAGKNVRFLLPEASLHYIHTHGLYRSCPTEENT